MLKTVTESAEVGVIVARFQVPELHEEHRALIEKVAHNHPRVIVILGLAADICKCTKNNPLDFPTRKAMVEQAFPNVEVLYIKDVGNNELWSKDLDRIIKTQIGPNQKVILYGGRDSFVPHYKGKYPTQELVPNKFISGKEIRRNVGIKSKNTKEFREGVIWAVENQWAGCIPCVDIAIIDKKEKRLLLGRKFNEQFMRFVGGKAKPESISYEHDAVRETAEETHIELDIEKLQYLGSTFIDAWPFRGEQNKIKTSFFIGEYEGGVPEADDDIVEVQWFDFKDLNEEMFMPEHVVLYQMLKKRYIDKL